MKHILGLFLVLATSGIAHAGVDPVDSIKLALQQLNQGKDVVYEFEGRTPKGKPCEGEIYGFSDEGSRHVNTLGTRVTIGKHEATAILCGGEQCVVQRLIASTEEVDVDFSYQGPGYGGSFPFTLVPGNRVRIRLDAKGGLESVSVTQWDGLLRPTRTCNVTSFKKSE